MAITMSDRDRLLDPDFRSRVRGAQPLFNALGGAIGHNLLSALLDRNAEGGRGHDGNLRAGGNLSSRSNRSAEGEHGYERNFIGGGERGTEGNLRAGRDRSHERDRSTEGERWMVMHLNRLLCVRYRLPIEHGKWKPVRLEDMCRWLVEKPEIDLRGEVVHEQQLAETRAVRKAGR